MFKAPSIRLRRKFTSPRRSSIGKLSKQPSKVERNEVETSALCGICNRPKFNETDRSIERGKLVDKPEAGWCFNLFRAIGFRKFIELGGASEAKWGEATFERERGRIKPLKRSAKRNLLPRSGEANEQWTRFVFNVAGGRCHLRSVD
ncbi:MAG: hypothetical protein ACTS5R_02345 [Candidatus Hodgkinia cicadicola]